MIQISEEDRKLWDLRQRNQWQSRINHFTHRAASGTRAGHWKKLPLLSGSEPEQKDIVSGLTQKIWSYSNLISCLCYHFRTLVLRVDAKDTFLCDTSPNKAAYSERNTVKKEIFVIHNLKSFQWWRKLLLLILIKKKLQNPFCLDSPWHWLIMYHETMEFDFMFSFPCFHLFVYDC